MKPKIKTDVGPTASRGARRPDLAARVRARSRALRARVEKRDAVVEAVREANATIDPAKVGVWLLNQASLWFDAPCWIVVAHDINGHLNILGDAGLSPQLGPSLWSAANWVMRHGVECLSGDLARDPRGGPGAIGSAIAFPLISRNKTIGVLVGLDPVPSTVAPALSPALQMALRSLLEPCAIALDNALALQKAEALSVTDDLTRLYNSRYLNLVLRRETKRAVRSGRPLSLLFLDLDGFKQVNDQHGHLAGSKALVEVGQIVKGCGRETDVVARFGGDEFSLVLPETGSDGAAAVATRITERIRSARFLVADGLDVRLTVSVGVATLPAAAQSAEDLLRAADMAMYRVKAAGKDGIHIAQAAAPRA